MAWVYGKRKVQPDAEFIAHEKSLICVSREIYPDGLEADEDGLIYAQKGSFIDKDGKVTVPTVTSNSISFTSDPVGILFSPVDVTNGENYGAVMIEGWVKGDYMDWDENEWTEEYGQALVKLMPGIRFKDKAGNVITAQGTNVATFSSDPVKVTASTKKSE